MAADVAMEREVEIRGRLRKWIFPPPVKAFAPFLDASWARARHRRAPFFGVHQESRPVFSTGPHGQ